ncbi:CRISPR-associated protein Cas4 [Paenibacillus sp. SC116]|uniref:CRISPR-associated protein Cas4 n=1 Tax=Paenibacillus sp. SC116 TaxID=2968986 RepID=UPI00215A8EBE|nr:CRISPR-associated protein Cas4 [Paenibacillus sp. SC116]MCR8844103.1 CRISPR-associated protein Cas4 [Paenibacillus sp. SC116]
MSVRGLDVQYYLICRRKCWLHHYGIGFEIEYDRVIEGTALHEESYSRSKREIALGEDAVVDAIEGAVVREIKISSRMEHADRMQMLYYLSLLKERGLEKKGLLSYPTEKKTVPVVLDEQGERELNQVLQGLEELWQGNIPAVTRKTICRKCAYYDYCFAGEGE